MDPKAISSSAGEIKQLQSAVSKSRENIWLINQKEEKIKKLKGRTSEIEEQKKLESLREELDQADDSKQTAVQNARLESSNEIKELKIHF